MSQRCAKESNPLLHLKLLWIPSPNNRVLVFNPGCCCQRFSSRGHNSCSVPELSLALVHRDPGMLPAQPGEKHVCRRHVQERRRQSRMQPRPIGIGPRTTTQNISVPCPGGPSYRLPHLPLPHWGARRSNASQRHCTVHVMQLARCAVSPPAHWGATPQVSSVARQRWRQLFPGDSGGGSAATDEELPEGLPRVQLEPKWKNLMVPPTPPGVVKD